MAKSMILSLLIFGMTAGAYAQVASPLALNKLRITNRAQCAIDSDHPTESAFIVVDGYNAGKVVHSLAKNIGGNPEEASSLGMQQFRIATSRLTKAIINKLLAGHLPLLPTNLKTSKLSGYNAIAEKCQGQTYCPELNSYLAKLWDNSEGAGVKWENLDKFTGANFITLKKADRVACYYLKRFSSLQEQLNSVEVDKEALLSIAQAAQEQGKYVTDCENLDKALESRNAIVQMDLKLPASLDFQAVGFDFWNSVKIYLSFAWRYSNIPLQVAPQYGQLFRSIALEESIMMIPNGCRSIEKPECDAATLSLNSIRELARPDGDRTEHSKEIPKGPEDDVVNRGPRDVNDDFLGTRSYEEAADWVENFRKNYVSARGSMKSRLQSSIQFLNIITSSMKPAELAEFVKPLMFAKSYSNQHRDELYYLCTEARLAGDKRLDFMKTGIDRVQQMDVMKRSFEGSQTTLAEASSYFDEVSTSVVSYCDSLERERFWNVEGYTVNRNGFNAWARELLNIAPPATIAADIKPMQFGAPLLVWDLARTSEPGNSICASAIECSRRLIKAMVDLYSVAKYADAFLPVNSTVATPDVFNPYADLKACKVYDPWFQTRRANKRLMADLASSALFGWNALPLYIDVDFKAPKVTSLNQMISKGVVRFDPKIEKEKMQIALLADFGPLMGAPCAVALAPNSAKDFNFYAFNGISVNYCSVKDGGTSVGSSPGNIQAGAPNSRSYCGGCSINFVGVAGGAAVTKSSLPLNPIKLGVYLFRAIHRFVTAKKDKVNIPRVQEVDVNQVLATYKKYGTIPDHCVDQLGAGVGCYQNLCAAKAADHFEKYTGEKVKSLTVEIVREEGRTDEITKSVDIKSDYCPGEVRVSFTCSEDGKSFKPHKRFGGLYGLNKACRNKIGQNFWGF
ncbi:hypothetical protein EZJ49_06895 [Bdellovibrio bacteriovorus]|uniref:hypothetical protein n=1 Tax=Bdellovibrio bacteriovorus TaxID=959 RepID=UPI0021CF9DD2|nr:hypothetical protein [Bdellovibrio bacteriovorus]UXR65973.1 hypothetical protein EZJ49_06895 [Bdellovibrio bacteriovorus]